MVETAQEVVKGLAGKTIEQVVSSEKYDLISKLAPEIGIDAMIIPKNSTEKAFLGGQLKKTELSGGRTAYLEKGEVAVRLVDRKGEGFEAFWQAVERAEKNPGAQLAKLAGTAKQILRRF
jgi:hypothetical protein